ncbi:MAG: DUF4359 domain-containing protein [Xanthomonadales bacterium]|nr:DUF4359 domain-containing protein [Xanthomonadales bacterium]
MKWLAAILLLLAVVLAVTNPDEEVYLDHFRATMLERAGQFGPTVQGLMWMFADDSMSEVAEATERRNFALFSLYRTDLVVAEFSCVGVLGRMVACESRDTGDMPETGED